MDHTILMAVLIGAPLLGFLINGVRYKKHSYLVAGSIATAMAATSFICSILFVADLVQLPPESPTKVH